MGHILVGTASWTDPGFVAEWYPPGLAATQRLPWYAEHFEMVEVNSTFYGIPEPRTVQRWCDQAPSGFVFNVKLHQVLSRHSADPKLLPPEIRAEARIERERVSLTPDLEQALAKTFLKSIDPFLQSEKLGVLLLQLTPAFSPKEHKLEELDGLASAFSGYNLAVEFRNRSWVEADNIEETSAFLRKRQLIFVMVDAPSESNVRIMPKMNLVTQPQIGYLRAHGRNARAYLTGRSVAERFDYDYSDQELEEIADRAIALSQPLTQLHLVFNNNRGAYAPSAATRMRRILAEKHAGTMPPPKAKEPEQETLWR